MKIGIVLVCWSKGVKEEGSQMERRLHRVVHLMLFRLIELLIILIVNGLEQF